MSMNESDAVMIRMGWTTPPPPAMVARSVRGAAQHCAPQLRRNRTLARSGHAMARWSRPRYLPQPDYARPLLEVTPEQRERIIEQLTVLYGELVARAHYWEVERLMQVHYAHKPPEMLRAEAVFDPR